MLSSTLLKASTFAAALCLGQTPSRMVRLPAPLWTGQPSSPQQHVYYDLKNNQLVVLTSNPAPLGQLLRFDLPNASRPTISLTLNTSANSVSYNYSITDSSASQQKTMRFMLLLPEHDATLTPGNQWQFSTIQTNLPDKTATVNMANMRWACWEDPSTSPAKVTAVSVSLQSTYFPGFVDGLVMGLVANPLTPAALSAMDPNSASQLQNLVDPRSQGSSYFLLGPLFRPGASKMAIATNYSYGIQRLTRGGQLNPESNYVKTTLASLAAFLQTQGKADYVPVNVTPSGVTEQLIQNALSVSLSTK